LHLRKSGFQVRQHGRILAHYRFYPLEAQRVSGGSVETGA